MLALWLLAFLLAQQAPQQPAAQAAPPQPPPQPFRGGVDIVEADAIVVDAQGRPVSGLTREDFTLAVDGETRAIESVTYVPADSKEPLAVTPAGRGNARPPARPILFVVDQQSISNSGGRIAIDAAGRLLDRLGADERVGLLSFPGGPNVDFTTQHEVVRAALGRIVGRLQRNTGRFTLSFNDIFAFDTTSGKTDEFEKEKVIARECPNPDLDRREGCEGALREEINDRLEEMRTTTRNTLATLSSIAGTLTRMRGPKIVVFISEGLVLNPDMRHEPEIAAIGAQLAAARITLFAMLLDSSTVDVSSATGTAAIASDRAAEEDSLLAMASRSGGEMIRITGKGNAAFDRVGRELSGYYLLSFSVLPSDRDGKPHRIQLKSGRSNVTVHARSEFVASPASTRMAAAGGRAPAAPLPPADPAASSMKVDASVSLRVGTHVVKDAGQTVRILMNVDVLDEQQAATDLVLSYRLRQGERIVRMNEFLVPLHRGGDGSVDPVSYVAFQGLAPGRYELDLSASYGTKDTGTLHRAIDARLHDVGPLEASDVLLAPSAPSATGPFPVAADVHIAGDQVVAAVEISAKGSAKLGNAAVQFEVTRAGDHQVLDSTPASLSASGTNRQFARGAIAIADLPAGEYAVDAVVIVDGKRVGSVSKPFRRDRP